MSLDPGKTSYQGLCRGDLVQLPDQSGVLRECSIYAINRINKKWTFDLYVAALDKLIRGVDVGIVRHMGGPNAPFVKDLSKATRPRPSSATTTRRTTRVRKPRPKSAMARSSSSQRATDGDTMRRTWGIDERFIPGTDTYKK